MMEPKCFHLPSTMLNVMNSDPNFISSLIHKYNNDPNEMSDDEMYCLQCWINDHPENAVLFQTLTDKEGGEKDLVNLLETKHKVLERLLVRITKEKKKQRSNKIFHIRPSLMKYVAGAAAVLLIGAPAYFVLFNRSGSRDIVVEKTRNDAILLPRSKKPELILADNSTVFLDSSFAGSIQGNARVSQTSSGNLAYEVLKADESRIVYNTIKTPRGGQYQVFLPDGSLVHLNNASSIRFPTVFGNGTRQVELNGEAWFEIAKDRSKPFIISVGEVKVEVTGTKFNLMGYNKNKIVTTLTEGSVKVVLGAEYVKLKPGEEGTASIQDKSIEVNVADMNKALAWKEGKFYFDNADIETIMELLSRWYDFTPQYMGKVNDRYSGTFSRELSLEVMLDMIQRNGGVKFRLLNKNILQVSR